MIHLKRSLTLFIFFLSSLTYGQAGRSFIGIEAGPSLVSVRGNVIVENYDKIAMSYAINISYQHNLNNIFSLHTGIGYERKGARFSYTVTDFAGMPMGTSHGYSRWNYISVPVLLRATFGKKTNLFVNAGPYAAYLASQIYGNKAGIQPAAHTNNISNDRRFDFGASMGAGLFIPLKESIALSFEIRDNLGLYNVSKVKVINDGTIKHNTLNFLFGFSYALKSGRKKKQ